MVLFCQSLSHRRASFPPHGHHMPGQREDCRFARLVGRYRCLPHLTVMQDTTPPKSELTALEICNIALSKLGEAPIPAIDANASAASRLCHMHYHPVRREVLSSHRWSFASVLVTLHSADGEDGMHSISHSLPQDCLRVLEVSSPNWSMRGRCIFCPEKSIRLLYIADVEDTSLFEPLFIEAFACRLACKLCIPLTSSITARKELTDEYQRIALPNAAHFNAVQSRSNDTHPLYRLWKQCLTSGNSCEQIGE